MEKISYFSNLYSHPKRFLEDHLINVSKLTKIFLSEKHNDLVQKYGELCKVIALSHDIGKATRYFQDYLQADDETKKNLKNLPETKHSFFSALCAYYLTKELDLSNDLFPLFAFITIRRHHGDLIDISDEVIVNDEDIKILYKQLKSIDDKKFSILVQKLRQAGLPLISDNPTTTIETWINEFQKSFKSLKKEIRNLNGNIENFIILNFIYSILLDADKSDAVGIELSEFTKRVNIPSVIVDNYKNKNVASFQDSPINYLRENAYKEVLQNQIDINHRIYSLNLPTGLGKTLTSLSFALKLKEQMGGKHRIIYALPFLSIIDQNASVFESVMKANGIEPYSSILLKHHHLSEYFYKKHDSEFEPDEAKILIEGWNSEIIVTTFVQLFHSMISNKNKSLRKFHRFANSIIILDEVQAIPVKYWLLLREILSLLSEEFNTYILFVTATEPLIFCKEEIKQLVNRDSYSKKLDRIKMITLLKQDITLQELYEYFDLKDSRSYLFVFNTISAARDFYNMIKKIDLSATYLSTHIIPKERLKRIKEIKDGKYKVVVSTQLVEAGVDIDFDVVVRDMAPLDSIIQSAGRCNRNYLKNKGEIYIVSLKDNRDRLYSSYIYDATLIDITREILRGYQEIEEHYFINLIDEYYKKVSERKTQDVSREIINAIIKLKYDSEGDGISVANFNLIEENYDKIDIFIELDYEAKEIWQKYIGLNNIEDTFKRKSEWESIKKSFYQYVISINSKSDNIPQIVNNMGYVSKDNISEYYDIEKGYITKSFSIIW